MGNATAHSLITVHPPPSTQEISFQEVRHKSLLLTHEKLYALWITCLLLSSAPITPEHLGYKLFGVGLYSALHHGAPIWPGGAAGIQVISNERPTGLQGRLEKQPFLHRLPANTALKTRRLLEMRTSLRAALSLLFPNEHRAGGIKQRERSTGFRLCFAP